MEILRRRRSAKKERLANQTVIWILEEPFYEYLPVYHPSLRKNCWICLEKMKRAVLNEADNVFMWWGHFWQNGSNEELYQHAAPSTPEHSPSYP